MMKNIASIVILRHRLVIGVWLVLIALGLAVGGILFGELDGDIGGNRSLESERANRRAWELNGNGGEVLAVTTGASDATLDGWCSGSQRHGRPDRPNGQGRHLR